MFQRIYRHVTYVFFLAATARPGGVERWPVRVDLTQLPLRKTGQRGVCFSGCLFLAEHVSVTRRGSLERGRADRWR